MSFHCPLCEQALLVVIDDEDAVLTDEDTISEPDEAMEDDEDTQDEEHSEESPAGQSQPESTKPSPTCPLPQAPRSTYWPSKCKATLRRSQQNFLKTQSTKFPILNTASSQCGPELSSQTQEQQDPHSLSQDPSLWATSPMQLDSRLPILRVSTLPPLSGGPNLKPSL